MMRQCKPLLLLFSSLLLLACSSTSQVDEKLTKPPLPDNWQESTTALTVENNWLAQLDNPQIQQLVQKALTSNHQFAMQAYDLEIAEQQLVVSGSELWPELDLDFSSGRNKDTDPTVYRNGNSINLNLSYELDIWGKLSDADRVSNFDYLAQKASFEQY
ncbi:MAG: TolC family protein, partial [Shewanella sp.]